MESPSDPAGPTSCHFPPPVGVSWINYKCIIYAACTAQSMCLYLLRSNQPPIRREQKLVQSPTICLTPDTSQLGGSVGKKKIKHPPPLPLWRLEETMSGEESSTERDRKLQPDSTPELPPPPDKQTILTGSKTNTTVSWLIAAVCLKCKNKNKK